jgi:hypothetical protein
MTQAITLSSPRNIALSVFDPALQCEGDKKKRSVKVLTEAEPTVWNVYLDFLKTLSGAQNAILKPIYYACDWILTFIPSLSTAKQLSVLTKNAKNASSAAKLPELGADIVKSASKFADKRDVSSLGDLANRIGLLAMPAVDVLKVFSDAVKPLTSAGLRLANNVYNSASVFTAVYGTGEELQKIGVKRADIEKAKDTSKAEKDEEAPKSKDLSGRVIDARNSEITQSWLKIGMLVNYFAMGALGLAVAFTELTVAPWVMLAFATGGLAFTLMSHFQKELYVAPALAKAGL